MIGGRRPAVKGGVHPRKGNAAVHLRNCTSYICFGTVVASTKAARKQSIPCRPPDKKPKPHCKEAKMFDQLTNSLTFVAAGLGIVATFCVLEIVLRNLTNRYGTPQTQR